MGGSGRLGHPIIPGFVQNVKHPTGIRSGRMPEIGEIRKSKELGYKGRSKPPKRKRRGKEVKAKLYCHSCIRYKRRGTWSGYCELDPNLYTIYPSGFSNRAPQCKDYENIYQKAERIPAASGQ